MRTVTAWILLAAVLSSTGPAAGSSPSERPELLSRDDGARVGAGADPYESREAELLIDLSGAGDDLAITISAFADASYRVRLRRVFSGSEANAWSGPIDDPAGGSALLVEQDGMVGGFVVTSDGTVTLRATARGRVLVARSGKSGAVEEERAPLQPPLQAAAAPETQPRAGSEPVDVLVLYTPAVRNQLQGEAAAQAFAATRIAELNTILDNSRTDLDARLVHAAEIPYTESGDSAEDLVRLQDDNDGYLDDAHVWRDRYGADLVTLVVAEGGSVGYLMHTVSPGFADWAFTVIELSMAANNFSMSHEIGHNLGSQHDRDNSEGEGAFDHSYGHRVAGSFRTVMAYPCSLDGLPRCDRQPYFSNPDVQYRGRPTGVPIGRPRAADNATGFDLVVGVVTAFRPTKAPAPDLQCNGEQVTRVGGPGADVIEGTAGRDVIHGLGGNDTITGLGGADVVCGGNGDDVLLGGGGKDTLIGGRGADELRGGAGHDTLAGGGGNDLLLGEAGNDRLDDGWGADQASGGAGADRFFPAGGNDRLDGNAGWDWVDHRHTGSAATVDLRKGISESSKSGRDTLSGIERARGTNHDDELIGNGARNVLQGARGDDVLRGRGGADKLVGNGGDDVLLGGRGDDTLRGGHGDDDLSGGPGLDVCRGEHPATCEA